MKILVDAAFASEQMVGLSRYTGRIVQALGRQSEVSVLTSAPEIFKDAGCSIVPIPRWTRSVGRRFVWQLTTLKYHCRRDFDVLFCPTPVAPPGVPIPVVSVVHDLTPLIVNRLHSTHYKTLFWLGLQTLHAADAVVVVSRHSMRDLARFMTIRPSRIHVVSEAPGLTPKVHPGSFGRSLQPYLLYVGGHWRHKNLVRLLAALKLLKKQKHLRLVVVGGGPSGLTREAITRLGLDNTVVLLSDVNDDRLSDLYTNCRAFVFPSLYEGFGLPVLEAMSHGAPVVCSRSSSLPEVAGEAALYFNPYSPPDIADKLRQVLDSPAVASALKRLGEKRARQFSWRASADRIVEIAARLGCSTRRPPGASAADSPDSSAPDARRQPIQGSDRAG